MRPSDISRHKLSFAWVVDEIAWVVDETRRFHPEPNGKCQTTENEDSCDKRAEDSPTHCSPWHFAKFIHR